MRKIKVNLVQLDEEPNALRAIRDENDNEVILTGIDAALLTLIEFAEQIRRFRQLDQQHVRFSD